MTSSNFKKNYHYYDLQRHWTKKIEPHLTKQELSDILVHDVHRYTYGQWRKPFTYGNYPWEFGSFEWRLDRRGRPPRYWQYVLYGGCHWLANFNLKLALLTEPTRPWRIISSEKHTSVYDGFSTIFEFNFLAFGIEANECFELANDREYPVGETREVGWCEHYSKMNQRNN